MVVHIHDRFGRRLCSYVLLPHNGKGLPQAIQLSISSDFRSVCHFSGGEFYLALPFTLLFLRRLVVRVRDGLILGVTCKESVTAEGQNIAAFSGK